MASEMRPSTKIVVCGLLGLAGVGCGATTHAGTPISSTTAPAPTPSSSAAAGSSPGVGALSAEAQSTATGDIPDNQMFLTFTDPAAGYSMSYPEGWARKGDGRSVIFSDKNNIVRIVVASGPTPTATSVQSELAALRQGNPALKFTPPHTVTLKSGPAIKATYTTETAPNAVTGKRVLLVVDRYELAHKGKRATIDLGTAKGVDNVDAYRMMSNSFRWQ